MAALLCLCKKQVGTNYYVEAFDIQAAFIYRANVSYPKKKKSIPSVAAKIQNSIEKAEATVHFFQKRDLQNKS